MWKIYVYIRKNPKDNYGSERLEFPIADRKLADFIKRIGNDPNNTSVYVTDIIPKELACISGQPLDLKEINDFAKRMCNIGINDIITYHAALEAYEPKTLAAAENILLNISSYFLIGYGKSLTEMGCDYLKACKGRVDSDDDPHKIGEKLMSEGKGIQTAHGYLFGKNCINGRESHDHTDHSTNEG